ncbi:hypothetical protein OG455_08265 [Kitasatospora sp. NBC_01287]|uniref:hypothetical protein n=1 Tax=Kitasatospora sp. NBC_01287 TaxID=2903573 RepID=UPI0022557C33|nr:hypothetical protein [Kitasatospora sp. NBC_01287]MCX4745516.1 hypothetical protein [Kitasatospora sp. NBC_01287]
MTAQTENPRAPLPVAERSEGARWPRRGEVSTRLLGVALIVAAVDPVGWRPVGLGPVLAVLGAGFAWWAAPAVPDRAERPRARLHHQLTLHRNTVLAVAAVLLAAFAPHRPWLTVAVTALLLAYLLRADAGEPLHRPPGRLTVAAAAAASALVLLAALTPTHSSGTARLLAVLGVAAAAGAVGLTLYERRSGDEEGRAGTGKR